VEDDWFQLRWLTVECEHRMVANRIGTRLKLLGDMLCILHLSFHFNNEPSRLLRPWAKPQRDKIWLLAVLREGTTAIAVNAKRCVRRKYD
jgi:hypothetical protein